MYQNYTRCCYCTRFSELNGADKKPDVPIWKKHYGWFRSKCWPVPEHRIVGTNTFWETTRIIYCEQPQLRPLSYNIFIDFTYLILGTLKLIYKYYNWIIVMFMSRAMKGLKHGYSKKRAVNPALVPSTESSIKYVSLNLALLGPPLSPISDPITAKLVYATTVWQTPPNGARSLVFIGNHGTDSYSRYVLKIECKV